MLTPLNTMTIQAELFVDAGRALAASNGVDAESMESLLRKVASRARRELLLALVAPCANDDGGPDG